MERAITGKPRSTVQDLAELLDARNGDQQAARALVERHGASMTRTAWRVLGRYSGTEADDVVQEAFIAALTTDALPRGDVGAWLRSIATRKALDALRAGGRRREQPLVRVGFGENAVVGFEPGGAAAYAGGGRGTDVHDPHAQLDVLAVREALAKLTAIDRAVLTLVDLEGFSMAEAADALGTTRVAVKLRAMRARRKLARLLTGQSGPAPDSGDRPSPRSDRVADSEPGDGATGLERRRQNIEARARGRATGREIGR